MNDDRSHKQAGAAGTATLAVSSRPRSAHLVAAARLAGLALAGLIVAGAAAGQPADTTPVGPRGASLITPANQVVTPAGRQVALPGMRPNALALSPDGRLLVTSGLTRELVVVDPRSGAILQRVAFPAGTVPAAAPVSEGILDVDRKAQLSYTGLTFSPDGTRIYLANVGGDIKVFAVDRKRAVSPLTSFALPAANAPGRANEIPAGLALSADGTKLYVAGNLSNTLIELDAGSGRLLRQWPVGVAPFAVVLAQGKAYVSNWGGRRPDADSATGPIGRGGRVRVDERSIASEGSVSIIALGAAPAAAAAKEIVLGPHACAEVASPDGRWVVVASAGSDELAVIDTRRDEVAERLTARQRPGDPFGAQPDALAFDRAGKTLYCANGSQNAVAVFAFAPTTRGTRMLGLIPVGWFPAALALDARGRTLAVGNLNAFPERTEAAELGAPGAGYNTKQYAGSLSLVRVPSRRALAGLTRQALAGLRYPLLAQAALATLPGRPPVPVPERVGEPSVFHHVIYIIKENRTYDQVLGDVAEGNGDPALCSFGERVTPNQHRLVREFALLDNTYCSGIVSADGHQWADSGIATEYVERSFAGWPRSYPAGGFGIAGRDALAYSPAGFLWNDALAHGRTVVDFGEFTSPVVRWKDPARHGKIGFADVWKEFTTGTSEIEFACEPDIEALRPYIWPKTIGWDLAVPDVWRAARFVEALHQFESAGTMPDLVILWLPNDHTSGTRAGSPTPAAQVADNDLAVGRVVDAVSHSKFWADTCIFAIEDDPQNGWDHVSGYRTTAYVVSPYTRRRAVVRTQHNQTSLLRTIELILGLPPMNQMDATATPMSDCFTATPDLTPFTAVPNQVPLDEMNQPPKAIKDAARRRDARVSARLPLDKADQCDEDTLNRILWRATMGGRPYPEWAVTVTDDD